MMETTAIIVNTPMMIPNSVKNDRSLFDQREPRAMEIDSLILTPAVFISLILLYSIRG